MPAPQPRASAPVFAERGDDPRRVRTVLHHAHDEFVSSGTTTPAVRELVAQSWRRSVAAGMDPELTLAGIRLDDAELEAIRAAHPLTTVMPVIRRLLVEDAVEAGLLVAVSDAAGQLLYVEGAPQLSAAAESMHFVPGADWSEASAGTNAPGTALALGRPVQILGAEHLSRSVTPWSCSAAPVRDPLTGAVLGVIDVTGGPDLASPQSLALVRATAAAAEAELRVHQLTTGSSRVVPRPAASRFEVLGRHGGVLRHGGTVTQLSARHSELLLALATAPVAAGLSGSQLAVALSVHDLSTVTVRAEVSRLRGQLGPVRVLSRPYRLSAPLRTDVDEVRDALRTGQLRRAVAAYAGPVLPGSDAPAVVDLRDDLHLELRSALLASGNIDAVLGFADTAHGRDDLAIWSHARDLLPVASPRRAQVQAWVERLDVELG